MLQFRLSHLKRSKEHLLPLCGALLSLLITLNTQVAYSDQRLCAEVLSLPVRIFNNQTRLLKGEQHSQEIQRQLSENVNTLEELRNLDQREFQDRRYFSQLIQRGEFFNAFRGSQRPLYVHTLRFSDISSLNNHLLTVSHTEKVLELIYLAVNRRLNEISKKSGRIVLHRWTGLTVIGYLSPQEFQQEILLPVKSEILNYLETSISSEQVSKLTQWERWQWLGFLNEMIKLQSAEVSKFYKDRSFESWTEAEVFKHLIVEMHLKTVFFPTRWWPWARDQYSTWSEKAQQRRKILRELFTRSHKSWPEALLRLHKYGSKPEERVRFQSWLDSLNLSISTEEIINIFDEYLKDLRVADLLQFNYYPRPRKKSLGDEAWVTLDRYPENALERRRLLFEKAKLAHYVQTIDLKSLGGFKRVLQDDWIGNGAKVEEIDRVFTLMNKKLRMHYNYAYSEIKKIIGPKRGVYIHTFGDDGILLYSRISREQRVQIEKFLSSLKLNLEDAFAGAGYAGTYVSQIVRIREPGNSSSIAQAIAESRDEVFDVKLQMKILERTEY